MNRICKHCKTDCSNLLNGQYANHVRWCDQNPNLKKYKKDLSKARSKITKESRERAGSKIKKRHKEGKYSHIHRNFFEGKSHSEETKELLKEKALNSNHRRLRRNVIEYKGVLLDSKWELELAKRLDSLRIRWIRPDPLKWTDKKGDEHNYFPDFYLLDYDLYIDPKNDHAYNVQKEKLEILHKTYDNILILKSLQECKEFTL